METNKNELINEGINKEIIKDDKYIRFYKNHLANKALEKLREVTKDINLSYNSVILNEFGKEINVKDEIKEYVEVFGNELIENLSNIDNKIDEWFFEYKVNEKQLERGVSLVEEKEINNAISNSIDNSIVDLEKGTIIEENNIEKSITKVKTAEKQLNSIEEKCVKKLENNKKLDNFTKKHLIDSFKSKISELKNNLSNILEKLNIVKKNTKYEEMTLNNNMKLELLSMEKLSAKTLDDLAKDENISILRKVVSHSNTSEKTLIYIANKVDDYKIKENLLNNENTPSFLIDKYLKEEDKDIVLKALSHKNVSVENLEKFSVIDDIEIQKSILNNENCSLKALGNIVKNTSSKEVLNEVSKHKNCAEELKEKCLNKENDKNPKLTLQEKLNNKKIEAEKINKVLNKDKAKEVSKIR